MMNSTATKDDPSIKACSTTDDDDTSEGSTSNQESLGTARTPWYGTTLVLLSEVMGTGILGLPHAAAQVGWVSAILFIVVFAIFAAYSAKLLSEVRKDYPEIRSFADAADILCGPAFGTFTRVCMLINWGALAIYYVISTAESIKAISDSGPLSCSLVRSSIALAILIVPTQCRDFHTISKFLSGPSTICIVVAVSVIVANLISEEVQDGETTFGEMTTAGPAKGVDAMSFLSSMGSFIFAYQGQSIFFELISEMRTPTQFPKSTLTAYSVMSCFYMLAVIVGFGVMGTDVPSFLPDALQDGPSKTVVGLLVLLHITVSYVIAVQPLHIWFHSKLFPKTLYQATPAGTFHWVVVTAGYLLFAFVVANLIPFFGDIQELIGAMFGAPIVFGWPTLFFILTVKERAGGSWSECFKMMGWSHCIPCFLALAIMTPLFTVLGSIGAIRDIFGDVSDSPLPFSC